MRVATLTALAVLTAMTACGGAGPSQRDRSPDGAWTSHESDRWRLKLPANWQLADRPLTPRLMEPREVLSVGTFPLRYRPTDCEAWAGSAQQDLPRDGAFVTVLERGYGWPAGAFPRRPATLTYEAEETPSPSGCPATDDPQGPRTVGLDQDVRFSDAGRNFHLLVTFGPDASLALRHQAYRIIDTLRFDPQAKPDWPSVDAGPQP